MILKIHPEAICYLLPQYVAWNCPHQFSLFPFLLIMTLRTWNLMKTSKPDADCDLTMFDIIQPMNKTAYWNTTTAAACFTNIPRASMKMRCLEKREIEMRMKRKNGTRNDFFFNLPLGRIRSDKINIFILFRRHFNPISSHIFCYFKFGKFFLCSSVRANVFLSFFLSQTRDIYMNAGVRTQREEKVLNHFMQ